MEETRNLTAQEIIDKLQKLVDKYGNHPVIFFGNTPGVKFEQVVQGTQGIDYMEDSLLDFFATNSHNVITFDLCN